ncbi:type IA DNA topoisomerase [Brevibacillus halotolerans]|uniref:type IA DNA topoisomerase n=1 Tax=Brevibacillus halotolerans TaxID=1507437 RepID=UPI0015EFBE31|nr:type IA DNA topoisomerase [Brevibacillus halotolerans]MBA4533816.1 topoisomerase C-terminal repeat-containing protein [Brevibacillus halotolerans]
MTTLIIAEKPLVAKAIVNSMFPHAEEKEGYYETPTHLITWSMGHLISLADPEEYDISYREWSIDHLPIIPDQYLLRPNPGTKKQLEIIKDLAVVCKEIISATDFSREGELIFSYILEYLKIKKPIKRLWTSSLTDDAIRLAFLKMKDISHYVDLLEAAKIRSISDWLIGVNATRAFTIAKGDKVQLERVHTPVVGMVYDRLVSIEQFKSTTSFIINAKFTQNNTVYEGIWKGDKSIELPCAQAISEKIKKGTGKIVQYSKHECKESPPKLFDLTLLQKEANSLYGYSPIHTLLVAQSLFESQYITYPKTSSSYVDETSIPFMHSVFNLIVKTKRGSKMTMGADPSLVTTRNLNLFRPDRIDNHHAILLTEKFPESLSDDQSKLYDMIVRRFISQFFPPATYINHNMLTEIAGEVFKTSIKQEQEKGWKAVYKKQDIFDEEDKENIVEQFNIDVNSICNCSGTKIVEKKTSPPKAYTEGTLIAAMQTAGKQSNDLKFSEELKEFGMGASAARAAILENSIAVGYLERKGSVLSITSKGKLLIEDLRRIGLNVLTSCEMTGEWEKKINEIAKGSYRADRFLDQVKKLTKHVIGKIRYQFPKSNVIKSNESIGPCPICKVGSVVDKGKVYGCLNVSTDCKFIISHEILGAKITEEVLLNILEKGTTPYLNFINSKGKRFEARLKLENNGKIEFELPTKSIAKNKDNTL